MDWKWKFGYLHGYGEALWEELLGKVRKITKIMMLPQGGMMLSKSLPCMGVKGNDYSQFDKDGFVIEGIDCPKELAEDASRAWNGSMIVPVNGAPRLKLT